MIVLAQASTVAIPEIPWAALSPELVLFGAGILVLLLDTAGPKRLSASLGAFVILVAAAGIAAQQTGEVALPAMVGLAAVAQLALAFIWRDRPRVLGAILTGLGFLGGLGVTAWLWTVHGDGTVVQTSSLLGDMVAVDGVALFTRVTVCLAGLVTVPLGYAYAEDRRIHRGEYYPLLLFAATGMTLLGSANDLIMVFIAIEVLSLALYVLTGFAKRDLVSQEAALKYFLLGAFSSAILLYGIAVAYGVTGTTNLTEVGRAFAIVTAPTAMTTVAMGLLLVGFAFKTAVVPFHMWTPDVYQGAPTPVTGFMAAATKAAAFAGFLRVFVGALGPLQWSWAPVISVLAVATMLLGAVLAVVQSDVKRMLGYSAVTHAGYVLIGLLSVTREGVSGSLFYLLVYAFMSLGSFGVLALLERRGRRALAIHDLRGLGRRYPVPAGMLSLFLLSLAGLPPTAGFTAKLAVFRAGVEAGFTGLVIVAVISSIIAAFFYIRIIVAMFMDDEPADVAVLPAPNATLGGSAGIAISAAVVVVLGVLPGFVVDLARQAASLAA